MGSSAHPTLLGTVLGIICIAPWVYLMFSAMRDAPPKQRKMPYREIQQRNMQDERAGFVEAKMQKIERAMR